MSAYTPHRLRLAEIENVVHDLAVEHRRVRHAVAHAFSFDRRQVHVDIGSCSRNDACRASRSSARRYPSGTAWPRPASSQATGVTVTLDPLRVGLAAIALTLGSGHEGSAWMMLAAHRQVALLLQKAGEVLEQRRQNGRPRQLFRGRAATVLASSAPVLEPETQEPHEREAAPKLVLHLVVREIVKLAENDRLEPRHRRPRAYAPPATSVPLSA